MRVGLIAVGTEVTSGEVVNSNASWIATQLEILGFQVILHLAVPDEENRLREALEWMESRVDLIVTTGGLGPTTDDCTAQWISDWLQEPFEFREDVFSELKKLYESRGLQFRKGHQTQCWFPRAALLVNNVVGSAHGFFVEKEEKKILVLPGPPREIQGMWNPGALLFLQKQPLEKKKILKKWNCLGITESDIAERVEEFFDGSEVELGYRASIPYVQVKTWFLDKQQLDGYESKFRKLLAPWLVGEGSEDTVLPLKKKMNGSQVKFLVQDQLTHGYLASRLWELGLFSEIKSYSTGSDTILEGSWIALKSKDNKASVEIQNSKRKVIQEIKLPFKLDPASHRAQKYFTELALHFWMDSFEGDGL